MSGFGWDGRLDLIVSLSPLCLGYLWFWFGLFGVRGCGVFGWLVICVWFVFFGG